MAKRLGAEHPGFEMSAWEIVNETLRRSGLPDAETIHRNRWHDCAVPFERAHFLDGFGHPGGRFRFRPDWSSFGAAHARMPELPDHAAIIDEATPDRPFRPPCTILPARKLGFVRESTLEKRFIRRKRMPCTKTQQKPG